jgi:hypothetical protein
VGSNELYYLDEFGQKRNAAIHAEILDSPEAEKVAVAISRKRLIQ